MDFSMVGLDNFVLSNSSTANGSGFQKQKRILNQDELRGLKVTKYSSFGITTEDQQKMLSFSSSSNSHSQNLALSEMSSTDMHGTLSGCKGPFTTSQWMELEHQALIYKHIIANVPVPSYLLNPIRKALESAGFPVLSGLKPNALGWGGFHLGFSNVDPEPGRCRRTDGKKWRCSKNAVAEHKYCERHMNRGRHRSRKPVEGHTASTITMTNANNQSLTSKDNADGSRYQNPMIISTASPRISLNDNQNAYNESCRPEFGLVCNDSLLNPLNTNSSLLSSRTENLKEYSSKSQHGLQQFMDEWPKNQSQHSAASDLMSSTSSSSPLRLSREPEATEMGLGMRTSIIEQGEKQASWAWETSTGGPLGEVLHSRGECKRTKALNLVESPIGPLSNQQWWE